MALSEDSRVAFKIAHLNMIQGVINRMSAFSASAKTFTVTILAGLAAISLQADKAQLGIIAMLATIVLGVIDIYYMTLELRFRAFYEHVESRHLDCADDLAIKPIKSPRDTLRALTSRPTLLFYLPVFSACTLFIVYGLSHDWWTTPKRLHESTAPGVEQAADTNPAITAERVGKIAQPTATQSARAAGRILGQHEPDKTRRSVQLKAAANSTAD